MKRFLFVVLSLFLLSSCGNSDYSPKPRAYIRFDLPDHEYQKYELSELPFSFETSTAATVELKKNERRLKWIDVKYPEYAGIIFLSYIPLNHPEDLAGEVDTSYQLLSKHFDFSSGVDERNYVDKENRVYATTYLLQGQNVASTFQFWATDSVKHFLRGSLYIDCVPNNDSLSPILEYLQQDVVHIVESLRWSNAN